MDFKKAIAAIKLFLLLLNQSNTSPKEDCAFLDATKAFDEVLHYGIYKKLLERGAPVNFIYVLQNWYGHLQCRVRWNNMLGELFPVTCGVRQGGILSPYLFAVYIDILMT